MKKHIAYPKIQQFRNIVRDVRATASYVGKTEDGDAIFDESIKQPTITFRGTVKLHGTNASVCYNYHDGIWVQSRNNIITPDSDNAGFASFIESRKDSFKRIIGFISFEHQIDITSNTIVIFGEWCGKGIQKGVAISEFEKRFFVFGIKVVPTQEDLSPYWIKTKCHVDTIDSVFNISSFKTFKVEVDFNNPEFSQNKFAEYTNEVEEECPVSKFFGVSGVGEGIVWEAEYMGKMLRFKTKGQKHSVSNVKKVATVDIEKLNSIKEFIEYSVTENRFKQAIQEVFGIDGYPDIKMLGDLIRWVVGDIAKEESDVMSESGLSPKDVNKYISGKVKEMFFNLNL